MCVTCGCSDTSGVTITDPAADEKRDEHTHGKASVVYRPRRDPEHQGVYANEYANAHSHAHGHDHHHPHSHPHAHPHTHDHDHPDESSASAEVVALHAPPNKVKARG